MNRFNVREAGEVGDVDGYDPRNAVGLHHGGKPRVMDLNAAHATFYQKLFPCRVGDLILGENLKKALDPDEFSLRFFYRESEAVIDDRAGSRFQNSATF